MSDRDAYVVRPRREASWSLVRDKETAASGHGFCRPDGRWFISIDTWDDAAYEILLTAMADDLRHDLHTVVNEADPAEVDRWRRLGFEIARREIELTVPVDPGVTRLADARPPRDVVLVAADVVDEIQLRELDDALRQDVPGSNGWRNDPVEFGEYTFDERRFDPRTYLVAVDDARREFVGLVRVWAKPSHPLLGLIAVTRHYRRRGLASALLGAVFRTLHERGVTHVAATVDATNLGCIALLGRIGATRSGATVEMIRTAAPSPR